MSEAEIGKVAVVTGASKGMGRHFVTALRGAGWRVGIDSYTPGGRQTVALERFLRLESLEGRPNAFPNEHPDVIYALRAERLRFAGAREYGLTVVTALDLNRNLQPRNDQVNVYAGLTLRGW